MYLSFFIISLSFLYNQAFIDITDPSGTQVSRHQSSFFGAGVTIVDYDNDGLDDIIVPTVQGNPFKVFKNMGDDTFLDFSSAIGFQDDNSESINVLVADYDNDGYDDVFVVNFSAASRLYHNNGDNTFEDVTFSAGVYTEFQTSRAACWLDYNRDSYIDLYMVNRDREEMNILFHNNGDGTFTDMTDFAGVDGTSQKMGLAVVAFDYDNDLWPDIYIGNDMDVGNIFYRNNGDGTFSDYSIQTGLDLAFSTMGLAVGDYDGDDDMDVYVTNLDWGNAMMRKNQDGTFTNVAGLLGMEVNLVCWGANFFDYDNDADLDLYVAAGCVSGIANNGELGCSWNGPHSDPLSHNNVLFTNIGNGAFADSSTISGLDNAYLTTGTAIGDINDDGFYDIYEINELDSDPSASNVCRLYKNNVPQLLGDERHWVKIKLEGTYSNRNAIGSRIHVFPQNAASQMREVIVGDSYSSQSSYTISVGLRNRDIIDSIRVAWPSGLVESHYNVLVDQTHLFIEGEGADYSACIYPVEGYDCFGNALDCSGNAGGSAMYNGCDTCICNGEIAQSGFTCVDSQDCVEGCDGQYYTILDDVPVFDECSVCDGDNSSCADCAGIPNGGSLVDECGVCDDNSSNDCIKDCFGVWGGPANIDVCGVCGGGIDVLSDCIVCPDSDPADCSGECGGIKFYDACEVCDGDSSTCSGCTNLSASNYDPNAIIDDGSCDLNLDAVLPSGYTLSNYPNPFNGSTRITLNIPAVHTIEVDIYNTNGILVDRVFKGSMVSGSHDIYWNPDNISSGIYFISVRFDDMKAYLTKTSYLK